MNETPKIADSVDDVSFASPWATVTSHQPGSRNAITAPANETARV